MFVTLKIKPATLLQAMDSKFMLLTFDGSRVRFRSETGFAGLIFYTDSLCSGSTIRG